MFVGFFFFTHTHTFVADSGCEEALLTLGVILALNAGGRPWVALTMPITVAHCRRK